MSGTKTLYVTVLRDEYESLRARAAELKDQCASGAVRAAEAALKAQSGTPLAADMARVYDLIGLHHSQPLHVLLENFKNMKRFAEYLHAVEREFFMVPGEPSDEPEDAGCEPDDECLVNRWGSSRDQYIEQFRAALARIAQQPSAGEYGDAYQGAREDLNIWKRRALESESKVRDQGQIIEILGNALNAENGPTFMGEPLRDYRVLVSQGLVHKLHKASGCAGPTRHDDVLSAALSALKAQPSAGVVLPERIRFEDACKGEEEEGVIMWNACLDEVERLNPCRAQAVTDEWRDVIQVTLRNYRMGTLSDGEGGGYPLIDAMSADGESVSGGIEEFEYLADAIFDALLASAPSAKKEG